MRFPASREAQSGGAGPGGPASAAPAGQPNPSFAAILDLLSSPAMQRQNQIMAKLRLDGQYAALFKSLNLTPDQVDQFKNLLVEKSMVGFDSMSAAQQQGIDPHSDTRVFPGRRGSRGRRWTPLNLLGSGGFTQFQQYQETVPARNTSNLLTQALSYTPTPLTETQADGLVQALTQYGTPPLPPTNPFAVLNGDLGVVKLSDQGLAQIQGILSAPQARRCRRKSRSVPTAGGAQDHKAPFNGSAGR